ncbi:hypothetical protein [Adonisia turfae]|uniref:Uncharacterized protein n=1 Tax=Adonisia turfae CCMR0081 TaxID=2292702 RepID=A0A6M0REE5_9CYAN|nr:hypothetical protein [Adonisia turfae]NEZ54132.1 hypothetical protein [Adonisia turfae CCMR0081]
MESGAQLSTAQVVLLAMKETDNVIYQLRECVNYSRSQGIITEPMYQQLYNTLFQMANSLQTERTRINQVGHTSPVYPDLNAQEFTPTPEELRSIYGEQYPGGNNPPSVA